MPCHSNTSPLTSAASRVTVANAGGLWRAETDSEHALSRIMKEGVNLKSRGTAPVKKSFDEERGFGMDGQTVVGYAAVPATTITVTPPGDLKGSTGSRLWRCRVKQHLHQFRAFGPFKMS